MSEEQLKHLFNDRLDILLNNFVNNYPQSYSTQIINNMIDNLNINNILIRFSIKVWQLTPIKLLNIDDIIDMSILAQLSYDTYLLFMDMPDICDYTSSVINGSTLPQIQLSIIWLTAFIMTETTDMIYRWQTKTNDYDKDFIIKMGDYLQDKIMTHNHQISNFKKLSSDIHERRIQVMTLINEQDKEFYQEIISFLFCLFVTRQINKQQYQKELLNDLDMTYYPLVHSLNKNKKNKKKKNKNQLKEKYSIKISDDLYNIYYKMYQKHIEKTNIGVPFL